MGPLFLDSVDYVAAAKGAIGKVLRMCGLVHGKTLRWGSLSYIVQWPEWNRMTGGSDFRTGPDTIRTCDQRIMSSENDNDD